jgi:hypothetical protein
MGTSTDSEKYIESYLAELRKRLSRFSNSDAQDIVEEIRSHILDKASGHGGATAETITSALAVLGTPQELASSYETNALLRRAQATRSPFLIVRGLFRWAGLSFAGLVALLVSFAGYCLGGAAVVCAILKPFHPLSVGLWVSPRPSDTILMSLRLGFTSHPGEGRELLGWWIVPLGLLFGTGILWLTFRFGGWSIRRFWHPRVGSPN